MRKRHKQYKLGSAASSALPPRFAIRSERVIKVPNTWRKDGARKRFSGSRSVAPPRTGSYFRNRFGR